jgi:membrane protease YdiL (CAAX protease family)
MLYRLFGPPDSSQRSGSPSDEARSTSLPTRTRVGPRRVALLLATGWLLVTVSGALVLEALAPSWSGTERALAVSVLLAAGVAVLLTGSRLWEPAGFNRPRRWRELRLLVLPTALVFVPIVTGFKGVATGMLATILVGEALTAFMEEAYFRGIILCTLRRTGALPAVLLSSVLFGTVHLGNVFFRDSAVLVLAQAIGAFCFGVGYAALRLRTGTLWPLIALHFLGNSFAALGALPAIPILVGQDVVLLVYGLVLVRGVRSGRSAPDADSDAVKAEPPPPMRVPSPRDGSTDRRAQPPRVP